MRPLDVLLHAHYPFVPVSKFLLLKYKGRPFAEVYVCYETITRFYFLFL